MNQEQYQPEDEIDLMDYVKVILKRKRLILAIFLGAAIVAGIFSFLMPKVYKIDTALEVGIIEKAMGTAPGQLVESPTQLVGKIDSDVYGIKVREKLNVSQIEYPKIKVENPKDTNLVKMTIESADSEKAKNILEEINTLILIEHQEKIKAEKELLEKNIELFKNNIEVSGKDIERIKIKISSLEIERKTLEDKIDALQKVLLYEQTPGTQFALFDTKEKLEAKIQEIESRYLEINSLETQINSFNNQINSIKKQIEDIQPTKIVKGPIVSQEPISPRPLLNIVIAAILGLFVGVFLAFFKEWWEKSQA